MKKPAALIVVTALFMLSPQSLLSLLSLPYNTGSWYMVSMLASFSCVMSCNILLAQPWRAGVIFVEFVGMVINAGILFLPAALGDTIKAARAEFVHPAFIIQVAIILLSMTPLGKLIESGRNKYLAANYLHGDSNRAQHRRHGEWFTGVVS